MTIRPLCAVLFAAILTASPVVVHAAGSGSSGTKSSNSGSSAKSGSSSQSSGSSSRSSSGGGSDWDNGPQVDQDVVRAAGLVQQQKYPEAIAYLRQIITAKPSSADAWNYLGFSLRKSGDIKGAGEAYSNALKINPNHVGARQYLGEMFVDLGQIDRANEQLMFIRQICGNCAEITTLATYINRGPTN